MIIPIYGRTTKAMRRSPGLLRDLYAAPAEGAYLEP